MSSGRSLLLNLHTYTVIHFVTGTIVYEKVSGGNPFSVETGKNHEKIVLKISKTFLIKMHYIGNVEFYRNANLQVETQKKLGTEKMIQLAMNSNVYNHYSFCYYLLLNLSFSYL